MGTRGQAGGRVMADTQQREALEGYLANPNICRHCHKVILPGPQRKGFIGRVRRKQFCNHSCAARSNNIGKIKNPVGPPRKVRVCPTCNGLVAGNAKYCSIPCRPKQPIALATKGQLRARYRELLPKYSWQASRGRISRHAHSVFKRSGKECSCFICWYSHVVHVCHVKSVSDFPPSATLAEINDIGNLVALCPNHHWEFDHNRFADEWKRIHKPRQVHVLEIPGSTPAICNQSYGEDAQTMGGSLVN